MLTDDLVGKDTIITTGTTKYSCTTSYTPIDNYTIMVYLDDGRIFSYYVNHESKVREHASAIIKDGYRHNDGLIFEHYPPHRILKIKCDSPISTTYTDQVTGT